VNTWSPANAASARSISVLVGTDHHEFSRLVEWADSWAAEHPQDKVRVQFGHSRAPASAEGHSFMSPAAVAELMATSDIVVAHGGPATISGARAAGHVPLVLPRDPSLGEHIDDHQQRFASWSHERSLITKVASVQELQERVSALLEEGAGTKNGNVDAARPGEYAAGQLPLLLEKARNAFNRATPGAPVVLYVSGVTGPTSSYLSALNSAEDAILLGDVGHLWERGIINNANCACGTAFSSCQFWLRVGKEAFGSWDDVDVRSIKRLGESVRSAGKLMLGVLPVETPALRRQLAELSSHYLTLFRAVQDISGGKVLVCCGADPVLAFALSHNREIDLRILYLAGKPDRLQAGDEAPGSMAARWLSSRMGAQFLRMRHVPRAVIARGEYLKDAVKALRTVGDQLEFSGSWPVAGSPQEFHPLLREDVP
jgi:UDP-N-acetylglucosamine transferase subunit ALG13